MSLIADSNANKSADEKKHILVVDDEPLIRELLEFGLQSFGYHVTLGEDGEHGFKLAHASSFDLIVSDVRMPNWDGVRFLTELRNEFGTHPPFLSISASTEVPMEEILDLGADAFLSKPLNQGLLRAKMSILLSPLLQQFTQIVREPINHSVEISTNDLRMGRRGFSLTAEISPNIQPGQALAFHISINQANIPFRELKGIGRVIWINTGRATGRSALGVEILRLHEPHADALVRFIESENILASIPIAKILETIP